jgi:hypothetical protein
MSSSPMLSRPTVGRSRCSIAETSIAPMIPNCSRCSGCNRRWRRDRARACVPAASADGADRRAVDAGQHLEDEAGNRHQRPGVARRYTGILPRRLDQIDRHPHRRVLLVAQGQRRRIIHGHHFGGTLERQALAEFGGRPQVRLECLGKPDQDDTGRDRSRRNAGRRARSRRAVIAPHAVDRQVTVIGA